MKLKLLKLILVSAAICIGDLSYGQLQVTSVNSAQSLAQKLVGDGVTISNVSLTHLNNPNIVPTGFFKNQGGTNIGIDSGIVITCGRAKSDFIAHRYGVDGNGTVTAVNARADENLGLPGDATLANELGISITELNDAIALEFDFVPLGDSIRFNYILSSEEYTVGTVCLFNDAFGFFISGPGITGSKNIALVPGTTNTPVTITNVNNISGAGCINNPLYYVDNNSNTYFLHEGHTKVFTAKSQVQPCETYHLKLVIADRGDHLWDTGVFLQAKSLTSNAIGMTNLTQTDPVSGLSYLVEGCATGAFNIRRPRKEPTPLAVTLSYVGTATNGVDVQLLPTSVIIPANDSFVTINVLPIVDGLPEGIETLKVYALAGCAAGTPTDSTIIQLRDYDILSLTPDTAFICKGGSIQLTASSGYTIYQWNADPTLSDALIRNPLATPTNGATTYVCTATEGTCQAQDSVFVKLKDVDFISKQDVNCHNASTGNIKVAGGGEWIQPVQFSLDGVNWQPDSSFNNLPVGAYWVKIKDAACMDSVKVTITQAFPDMLIDNTTITDATCTGDPDGTVDIAMSGGSSPYAYSSDGTNYQPGNILHLNAGSYTIRVKDNNGCTASQSVVIALNNTVTVDAGADADICDGNDYIIDAVSNGVTFTWTPATRLSDAGALKPTASPSVTTKYYITAIDGICSNKDSITIRVRPSPVADAGPNASYCAGKVFQLNGSGGSSFQWSPSTYFTTPSDIASPSVKATSNMTYYLTVTDVNGCKSLTPDAVDISITPAVKIFAGNDTVAAINQPIQLRVVERGTSGVTHYSWSPGSFLDDATSSKPVATLPYDYRYIVTGTTADGCEGKDDIFIKVYKGPEIYVPSGFTPDNNGLNDLLIPVPVGIKDFHFFRVFNRWGQLVFASPDFRRGWDGKINGVMQPTGTYIWMAEAIDYKGNLITRKGVVTIIR